MPPQPPSLLSPHELAALIRRVTGAEPPAALILALHRRVQADAAALAEIVRCFLADPCRVEPALQALVTDDSSSPEASHEPPWFRREGDYWTIAFGGSVVRLHDRRGLRYLAKLLDRPGERISAQDLVAAAAPGQRAVRPDRARLSVTKAIANALMHMATHHPALAVHLQATVHRGCYCTYQPDPRVPIRWIT
jgi:hypothetical protein